MLAPVEVTSEYGGRTYTWTGYVDRAEAALDEQTRTVGVIVRVPRAFEPTPEQPARPPLLIGSYANADIEGRTFDRYTMIPAAALRENGVVWTVRSDTQAPPGRQRSRSSRVRDGSISMKA